MADKPVTLETIHQETISAYDAWQAEPENEDLRTTFNQVVEKAKGYKAPEPVKPPDKYELKLPESSLLDPSITERISAYAKEKGLSNEAAQELIDRENQVVTSYHEAQLQQVEGIKGQWVKDAEADKEIGGEAFKENIELAKRVIDKFGSDAFKAALNETGFGNHPEVIRIFTKIGKLMAEDKLVLAKTQSAGSKPMEEVFYGTT